MIADIQAKEFAADCTENQEQFVTVQDQELMYVGGGCPTGTFA